LLIVIIGDKYKFTKIDKQILQKKHHKLIFIKNFKQFLTIKHTIDKKTLLIVNNEKELMPIKNFTDITKYKYFTIEQFLEKYLKKIYIPKYKNDYTQYINIKPFNKFEYFLKRVVDFSIAIPLGILTIPIMIYSAYRIKKESPDGPIFFKQTRIGKNKKAFTCYKFRSMRTDIDFFDQYTQENDPRIFPWGKIMRKTRIDELPQLINVIKGDLHIIGPRAEWDELVKRYEKEWSFYHLRHINAPGITGWAQVNYPYGKNLEDTYQKLMYDLYYIKNWSLWLEIKIIFKTIWVMVKGKGL